MIRRLRRGVTAHHGPAAAATLTALRHAVKGARFAHGRAWASLGLLEREELTTGDPDILHARMTSDLPRSLVAPQRALDLCDQLLATYRMRSTPAQRVGFDPDAEAARV